MQHHRMEGDLVFGVRPEHIVLSDDGSYRGEILATEYLGHNQIVTVQTEHGVARARTESIHHYTVGDSIGMTFNSETVTLFDQQTGAANPSVLNEGVVSHG